MYRLRLFGISALVILGATVAGSAQQWPVPPTASRAPLPRVSVPLVLPGTRETAFIKIQGNALDALSNALPNTTVRLRDAHYGRVIETQITDKSGLFAFNPVDPGTYVAELVGADQMVLAASQLLSVAAGETASTVVKLPFGMVPFAGLLGHAAPQAHLVTSAAAASGVQAQSITGVDASSR